MNKKAMTILLISSFAFLTAMLIFFSLANKTIPGKSGERKVAYLGEIQIETFSTYYEAEKILLSIDLAAKYSFDKAKKEGDDKNLEANFKKYFAQYLSGINNAYGTELNINNYSFFFDKDGVKGITGQKITIKNENIEYSVSPNFLISY